MPIHPSPSPSSTRHILTTISKVLLIISTAFAAWHSLCFITASSSPVVVVISESMEPAFYRGDVLFVWNRADVFEVGEIAVCWFKGRPLPMVHRIVQRMPDPGTGNAIAGNERSVAPNAHLLWSYSRIIKAHSYGWQLVYYSSTISVPEIPYYQYLTKGDNNDRDDVPLYPPGQRFVKRREIIGTIKGYVPYAGWITILLSEHPWLKTAVFGAVGSFSLLRRKPKTMQTVSGWWVMDICGTN